MNQLLMIAFGTPPILQHGFTTTRSIWGMLLTYFYISLLNLFVYSRVYPKSLRANSSNMNPVDLWSAGVQMVALNYQSSGRPMYLNHGKFMQNHSCGYVLKPPHLRSLEPADQESCIVKLHIISGRYLPKNGTDVWFCKLICMNITVYQYFQSRLYHHVSE